MLIIDVSGGPTPEELWKLLDQCDLSNSHSSTPCISPCPSLISTGPSIKTSNVLFLNQSQNTDATPGPSQVWRQYEKMHFVEISRTTFLHLKIIYLFRIVNRNCSYNS